MGLTRDRTRIYVKGLGNLQVRQIEPTAATVFSSVGYLKSTQFTDDVTSEEIIPETGELINVLAKQRVVKGVAQLQQSGLDELGLLINAGGQVHAIRYFGSPAPSVAFQFFCFEQARIKPGLTLNYQPGERLLPMEYSCLKQDSLGYDVPEYYVAQVGDPFYPDDLSLWMDARWGYNVATTRLLDISGFGNHGLLDSTGLWQVSAAPYFMRFNGTANQCDLGNVLNGDTNTSFVVEAWVRFPGTNGVQEEILAKKTVAIGNTAGFALYRNTSNQLVFVIGSGSANVPVTSTTTALQNVWRHVAVVVSRAGSAQIYVNGNAEGSASVAALGTETNALSLFLGRDGTNFGQVDLGGVRIHRWPGGTGLGANATAMPAAHYAAEKAYYGL
jgi:hypothetical protein